MKRPILIAVIGYLIGILMGLYFNFSIVPFYFSIIVIYFIIKKLVKPRKKAKLKLISFKRYFRYVKIFLKPQILFIIVIISITSNSIILMQNNKYNKSYEDGKKYSLEAIIVSNKIEKEYSNLYKIKITSNNTNLYLKTNKNVELEYGDKLMVSGTFEKPFTPRNYGGFDYSQYLKTLKIYGTLQLEKQQVIQKNALNPIYMLANKVSAKIKQNIDKVMEAEEASICKGLILGDTSKIEKDIQENFRTANISHILAVSGMHTSYIIIGLNLVFKNFLGKRKTKYTIIIFLSFYMFLTGFSASVVRAVIMGIIVTLSGILYRKNDIWTSIAISLLILLIDNPYSIMSIGLQLSYLGTIGIIVFNKNILKILKRITIKNKKIKYKINGKIQNCIDKLKEILAVTLSAQIGILPVMIYHFNIFGVYVLISNLLVSLIIGPIMIIGVILVIISFICIPVAKGISEILMIGIQILIQISNITSNLPLSKIYLKTPTIESMFFYYLCASLFNYIYSIYHQNVLSNTKRRIRNLIALSKFKLIQNKNTIKRVTIKILIFILIFICINPIYFKNLKIYFVDVGQGDCTFIVTPKSKTILIDGGGSLLPSVDVGKNTLIPYLLDRGYTKIDYIFISHFDQDHVGGILTILEELKVGQIVISKQTEDSENYQKFLNIVEKNKLKVQKVQQGDMIMIENDLYFDILWPQKTQITENVLNNNSIVAKLNYYKFSMLFVGDIEKQAEEKIIKNSKIKNMIKANVLKVAHHGSNTSTTEEFLKAVNPRNRFNWSRGKQYFWTSKW